MSGIKLQILPESSPRRVRELSTDDDIFIPGRPDFIKANLPGLLAAQNAKRVEDLDPKVVGRYLYPRLLDHRAKRYGAIAERIGYSVSMADVLGAKTGQSILELIAATIDQPKTAT